ncbi:MAG: T9SS type A sorting domain-containing protein [candidate division WOR-3 bacterium]
MPRFILVSVLIVGLSFAQTYRCDWAVNDIGGGGATSLGYKAAVSVGQTAAGRITGSNWQAFLGFWQIELPVGISEAARWPDITTLETRLYPPAPNPFAGHATIRYSVAVETEVRILVYDAAGRVVTLLASSSHLPGCYELRWAGNDRQGRPLANGIYFCKFIAGQETMTSKLLIAR